MRQGFTAPLRSKSRELFIHRCCCWLPAREEADRLKVLRCSAFGTCYFDLDPLVSRCDVRAIASQTHRDVEQIPNIPIDLLDVSFCDVADDEEQLH